MELSVIVESEETMMNKADGIDWTKRDDLAAMFEQGLLAAGASDPSRAADLARDAFRFADAFLAARAGPSKK